MSPRPMAYSAREGINRRLQPRLAILECCGRRAVVVHSRPRGFGSEPLEHAIQIINKFIFEHEERRQRQRARRAGAKDGMEVDAQPVGKPITFKASASTEKLVKEPPGSSSLTRSLSAYLALPLDQYSLLDPGWISRSPIAPDVFVLRIPLFDLVGLELQPQITVRVSLDPRSNQVHFHADQFKVGDPRFDADFKLAMKATLRNKPVPTLRPLRSIKRMWARAGGCGGSSGGKAAADMAAAGTGGSAGSSFIGQQSASAAVATGLYGSGGDAGSPAGSDADEEDVVVQVIDGGGIDGGLGWVSGSSSGDGGRRESRFGRFADDEHQHRAEHHSYGAYGSYEAADVVDVEMEASSPLPGSRSAPVVSPHKTLVHGEEGTAAGLGPSSAIALGAASTSNAAAVAVGSHHDSGCLGRDSSSSSSSSSTSGAASSLSWDRQRYDSSSGSQHNGAGSNTSSSSSRSSSSSSAASSSPNGGGGSRAGGGGMQVWPPAAYGSAHAAATAAAVATTEAGRGLAHAASPSTASMGAAAAIGAVAASQIPAIAARSLPVAAGPAGVTHPADAVATTVASAASSPSAPTDLGVAPFVEDSVLYVPANQWGRAIVSSQSGPGTSRTTPSPTGAATATARAAAVVVPVASKSSAKADADPGTDATDADVMLAGPGNTHRAALRSAVGSRAELDGAEASSVDSSSSSRSSAAVGGSSPATAAVMVVHRTAGLVGAATGGPQGQEGGSSDGRGSSSSIVGSRTDWATMPVAETTTAPAVAALSTNGAAGMHGSTAVSSSATPVTTSAPPEAAPAAYGRRVSSSEQYVTESAASSSSSNAATTANTSGSGPQGDLSSTARLPAAEAEPPPHPSSAQLGGEAAVADPLVVPGCGAATAEEGATALLVGSVDVAVTVMLPPALATVPRPLLGMTGSLIARYAIASLLPSFLDLLVADYGRWSSGQTVAARAAPVGDLAAVAAANAAPMRATGATQGTRAQQGQEVQQKQQQELKLE